MGMSKGKCIGLSMCMGLGMGLDMDTDTDMVIDKHGNGLEIDVR